MPFSCFSWHDNAFGVKSVDLFDDVTDILHSSRGCRNHGRIGLCAARWRAIPAPTEPALDRVALTRTGCPCSASWCGLSVRRAGAGSGKHLGGPVGDRSGASLLLPRFGDRHRAQSAVSERSCTGTGAWPLDRGASVKTLDIEPPETRRSVSAAMTAATEPVAPAATSAVRK